LYSSGFGTAFAIVILSEGNAVGGTIVLFLAIINFLLFLMNKP
jgi:hypothetical protein